MTEHTPTPWKIYDRAPYFPDREAKIAVSSKQGTVAVAYGSTKQEAADNATKICRSANCFDELVAALEWAVKCWETGAWLNEDGQTPDIEPIHKALAKAKGDA